MQERGFSLIELLIVIAIILVISAIAVPSLLHSKIAANEASAVYSIRTVNTAQVTYATTYPTIGYAATLNMLASPTSRVTSSANAGVLDWVLGCTTTVCPKSGYDFQLYNVNGSPTINWLQRLRRAHDDRNHGESRLLFRQHESGDLRSTDGGTPTATYLCNSARSPGARLRRQADCMVDFSPAAS